MVPKGSFVIKLRTCPYPFFFFPRPSSRDSYIHLNNGGLASHRGSRPLNSLNLRASLHQPEQVILLPSYHTRTSNQAMQSQSLAMARQDPKMRALRQRQREMARYLHTTRGRVTHSTVTMQRNETYRYGYNPLTSRQSASSSVPGAVRGSQTARSSSSSISQNPYQVGLSSTWSAGVVPPMVPTNFAETLPLSRQDITMTSSPQPPAQQYTTTGAGEETFPVSSKTLTLSSPSSLNEVKSPRTRRLEQKWVAPELPSYYRTLPKNSSYLNCANTHYQVPNLNDYEPAGFSIEAKLRAKGIGVHPIPLLG